MPNETTSPQLSRWGLHHACGWQGDAGLPVARRGGARPRHHDRGHIQPRRHAASHAAGVHRPGRIPVRLLHAGPDRLGGRLRAGRAGGLGCLDPYPSQAQYSKRELGSGCAAQDGVNRKYAVLGVERAVHRRQFRRCCRSASRSCWEPRPFQPELPGYGRVRRCTAWMATSGSQRFDSSKSAWAMAIRPFWAMTNVAAIGRRQVPVSLMRGRSCPRRR